jgi:flagellar basal body-associated protein FliL
MEDKALMALFKDMLEYKKKEARFLFIALMSAIVAILLLVGAFLYFESQMETTTTTTTTTTEQEVNGNDGNIVNGDQYNDKAQNKGVVNNVSETDNN